MSTHFEMSAATENVVPKVASKYRSFLILRILGRYLETRSIRSSWSTVYKKKKKKKYVRHFACVKGSFLTCVHNVGQNSSKNFYTPVSARLHADEGRWTNIRLTRNIVGDNWPRRIVKTVARTFTARPRNYRLSIVTACFTQRLLKLLI